MKTRFILTVAVPVMFASFLAAPLGKAQQQQTPEQRRQMPTTTTVDGWYKFGVPFPDPNGPAPRLPNGKPDLSGQWSTTRRADITNNRIPGFVPEVGFTAWGQRQWDNYDPVNNGDYAGSCLPFGWSRQVHGPRLTQFVQTPDKLVVLAEQNTWFHIVYTDGRPHDPNISPTWWGDSVGHWEGDTLVVVTKNMNGYIKLDTIGHPISSQATFTQTFKRPNFGTIEHTFTIDDPKTYTRPITTHNVWPLEPLTIKMLEYSCEEGNLESIETGSIKLWKPPEGDDAP